jgi:hypothetical protein
LPFDRVRTNQLGPIDPLVSWQAEVIEQVCQGGLFQRHVAKLLRNLHLSDFNPRIGCVSVQERQIVGSLMG